MFGIGSTELLLILVVALIVLGPKSLAGVSRSLGKAVGEFRRVSTDFQRTLNAEAAEDDLREREKAAKARQAAEGPGEAAGDGAPGSATRTFANFPDAKNSGKDVPPQPGADNFGQQMARIGKWENPAGAPMPPPDSPIAEALAKSRTEAAAYAREKAADRDGKAHA